MSSPTDKRRRWLGAVFLVAALGMLVAGQTLLRDRLDGIVFVFYWLACFVFTGLAVLVAFLDAAIVNRRAREEQRRFLEDTLRGIERERSAREQHQAEPSDQGQ